MPDRNRIIMPALRVQLLSEIGYDDRKNSCRTCAHHQTIDDLHQDRAWIECCDLFRAKLGLLVIEEKSVCNQWTAKEKS